MSTAPEPRPALVFDDPLDRPSRTTRTGAGASGRRVATPPTWPVSWTRSRRTTSEPGGGRPRG
ncbi:hypothetical protein [Streptomyces thioluteus]|uniref:hypothetical protein n=1 Tax=Streptomyces thioluteus TaxID=66431 RepID=UPI0031E60ABD